MERQKAHNFLRKEFSGDPAIVEEYISEGEHQEGTDEFWLFFDNTEQLAEDFNLYRNNC